MVNVKGRCKAHGSEQQEFCIFKKQKKQKGEPGMRTAIFPENGRRMMSEMMCMCSPNTSLAANQGRRGMKRAVSLT